MLKCCHLHERYHGHDMGPVEIAKADLRIDFEGNERRVERATPKYARTFLRWVDNTSRMITDEAIRIAVQTGKPGSITGIFDGLPYPKPTYPGYDGPSTTEKAYEPMVELENEIAEEMLEQNVTMARPAGEAAWAALPRIGVAVKGKFNIMNPFVIPEAQARVGWLITEVRNGTQEGLRDVIAKISSDAYDMQLTTPQASRQIRSAIGLRADQMNALLKVEERAMARGVTGDKLERLMERETRKRLNYRASMIGRTELNRAASMGRHAAWKQAQADGFMQGKTAYVEWVAGLTDRTCPICANLHGERVQLGNDFTTQGSDLPDYQQVSGETPPIHPLCRCTTILVMERT
jgi:SPP1 gp7 family putative phage head morphogenesis protein